MARKARGGGKMLKVTRNAPGHYTVQGKREWVMFKSEQLSQDCAWVAYDANDKSTVLDPMWTKRETLAVIRQIENKEQA